ncbi:uncharacterized protein LOC143676488 isoform X4 [Tamandua tetradactyla]|uniref:uncharacterized protein LOC143676488 isoform X4 n=1 Tax=Tamandua tetradactyla TaxID=48850 RepID=UPI004053B6E0
MNTVAMLKHKERNQLWKREEASYAIDGVCAEIQVHKTEAAWNAKPTHGQELPWRVSQLATDDPQLCPTPRAPSAFTWMLQPARWQALGLLRGMDSDTLVFRLEHRPGQEACACPGIRNRAFWEGNSGFRKFNSKRRGKDRQLVASSPKGSVKKTAGWGLLTWKIINTSEIIFKRSEFMISME